MCGDRGVGEEGEAGGEGFAEGNVPTAVRPDDSVVRELLDAAVEVEFVRVAEALRSRM